MKEIIAMRSAKKPNGEAVDIYEIEDFTDAGTVDDPNRQRPGVSRMELADGRVLALVGHGEYKIEGTDEVFLVKGQQ